MTDSGCEELEAQGVLARYVAGTLDDEASAAFEDHFLTCPRCQANVKVGLVAQRAGAALRPKRRSRILLFGSAASLAAACMAGLFLWQRSGGDGLRSLGLVEVAPLYLGAPVRAGETPGVALFDSAMALYAARSYSAAAAVFERARATGADDAALDFFMGASHLMAGAPIAAEAALTAVINRPENLYSAEAYYYRAKARLQRNDEAGALRDLRRAAALEGATSERALVLLKKLEE